MDDLRARSRYVAARSLPLLLLLAVAACGGGEEAAEDAAPAEDAAAATGALPLPAAGDSAAATAAEPDTTAFAAAPDETARAAGPDAGAEARTVAEPEPATERAPEEPPAPRPVAEAATAPGGEYSLQVGSFSRAANAEALRDRLAELGHTAVVETAFVDGRTWHRVVLPGFDDRTTALQIGEALHRRLDIEYLVRRQP